MPSLIFKVVLVVLMSYNKLQPFKLAHGKATLVNQNMKMLKHTATAKMGLRILTIDIPALFKAVNSKFSPNFPKVIKEESRTERGNASGSVMSEK